MPERKPDTVLTWAVARELAVKASCDPRTIQAAAKGEYTRGDPGRRARAAVAAYFDENPSAKPAGWKRPSELPLSTSVARELAIAAGVDARTIQRAAAGERLIGESGAAAKRAVEQYRKEHPGHVLEHEAGEPSHLGRCERCGATAVVAGDPCPADERA